LRKAGAPGRTSLLNLVEMKLASSRGHSEGIRTTCFMQSIFLKGRLMNVVYVLAPDDTPLMPCACVVARLLLKEGKAKVVRRTPFTITLLVQPTTPCTQHLTLGVDTGSSVIGSAVADSQGQVVYHSEVTVRNDNALSSCSVAESQTLDQAGAVLTHDEE
jgi:RRXRR protein